MSGDQAAAPAEADPHAGRPAPKAVVLYHSAPDVLERAPTYMAAHGAVIDEFHGAGELLMVGVFGDPAREGAMCVFRTRDAAERFVRRDPFVTEGLVARYEIRDWNEILVP
jgi:uncharacterized protein YciI